MTQAVPEKETKAQKGERLKREKNPWLAFDEVRAFAREGRASVLPEWANFYFKWWGVYTQGDGVGATGGKGGEGLASDYFMMRIGIPNGIVSASQLRLIGGHSGYWTTGHVAHHVAACAPRRQSDGLQCVHHLR